MEAPKYSTYFSLDIMIHTTILFTFLATFFFLYVSKIEEKAFQSEISDLIDENLSKIVLENENLLKPIVMPAKPILTRLQKVYAKPDRYTTEKNRLIKLAAVFVLILLLCTIFTIVLTVKLDCGKNVNIGHIILENIIVFIFVAIVEFWFFTNIAIKYIPTSPSLMVNTLINSFKDDFKYSE